MIVIMLSLDTVQGRVVESQGVTLLTELEWQYGTLVDRDQEEVHRPREVELSTNPAIQTRPRQGGVFFLLKVPSNTNLY